jgi:hypothetical protein
VKNILLLNFSHIFLINTDAKILNFNLANPQPNLMESWAGTIASGDINGDGDKDLLMTGIKP